jgi:transglutaminase-like putative cysteine protease
VALIPGPRLTNGRRLVRGLAVTVFGSGLALSGARVVGSRLQPVLFIPVALAVLVGWSTSRLPAMVRIVGQVAAFAGSGVLVAYGAHGTKSDLGHGLVDGPRQVLTTRWPSPQWPTIYVALAALIFIAVAGSIELAMRVRWRALAIIPCLSAAVALLAVGSPDGPQWAPVVCGAAAMFVLLWIGLDDRVSSVRWVAPVALLTGLAALLTTVGVALTVRADPRHDEAANQQLSLLDPLAVVAAQHNAEPPRPLFTVSSPSLDLLTHWRTAVLDVYNGESWTATGRLTPVGNKVAPGNGSPQATVAMTALTDESPLWAMPGALLRTSQAIETDADQRIVRVVGSRRPTSNTVVVEPTVSFDPARSASLSTIKQSDIESTYRPLATQQAGDGTFAAQVASLASVLKTDYTFDSKSPGGVQQKNMDFFLKDTKVGNQDQFVTGFVLLARSLGIDARVATGYILQPGGTSAQISTAQAQSWPEVHTAAGWAAVDVMPADRHPDGQSQSGAAPSQTPQAAQPPRTADEKPIASNDSVDSPVAVVAPDRWVTARLWALRGGLFSGLLLWPIAVFAAIVTWKKRRRRKGLKSTDLARRVSTAWVLATDALVDAGATLQASQTNAELVEAGVSTQPGAGPSLGRLQRHADAVTFTSAPCDPARAADAIEQLRVIESSIRSSSSQWWRWKWWLSTRSLRRLTQSPLRSTDKL